MNGVWRLKKNLKLFGLLFIEKETFLPLLRSVLTDETYSIKFVRWHLRASLQLVMLKKEFLKYKDCDRLMIQNEQILVFIDFLFKCILSRLLLDKKDVGENLENLLVQN